MKPSLQLAPTPAPKRELTLEEREKQARAEIAEAERLIASRVSALDRAEKIYTETREPMDRVERDCAIDRLHDARTALETLQQSRAPLFAEADRARRTTLLDELRAKLNKRGAFGDTRDRMIDTIATFRRDLQGLVTALQESVRIENSERARATSLAQGLTGEDFFSVNFDTELAMVVDALIDPQWQHRSGVGWVMLDADKSVHSDDIFKFELKIRGTK